ncbi:MAG TPA: dihydrolipoyl dehydrogenase [Noviherbaspirillum sp.]|jgi:dihydrolipoamide dehydrogenase|uniref:dihydrolipoyl dehydrogenase n=1 Tax=Noviherbaspirillum sp. TaxID=1926288 RepID=UPI002DDDB80A|nr:dihydrolipoyl dehydrogenase [Noviherbaspirillum sp.]HEV2610784.1 dihydrolipoyl dehydrogenase [Noviherbaspirillum sp.]
MKSINVDVAVIGAGSAGMTAFRAAQSHGKHVVLIEGGPYGTTCARVGCMPSKLLIAAAEAAHAVAEAPGFGVHPGPVRVDGKAVMAWVQSERDRFVGFVVDNVHRIPDEHRLHGYARFVAEGRLQVDDHTLVNAATIVIATGSTPYVPPELSRLGKRLVTSDEVFDWNDLPASVAVVGSGVIGLELGQALHRLGVRVTVFGRGSGIAHMSDPAVVSEAVECIKEELDLRVQTRVVSATPDGDAASLTSMGADGVERVERFDFVLAATGRTPNLHHLNLKHSGLQLDTRGMPLFDPFTMRCGDSAVFIAGDVNNERPLLHEATDQGRIAGDNAGRYPEVIPGLRRAPLGIGFTDPQLAIAGSAFGTLKPGCFAIGEVRFASQGRSRVMRQNRGVLRVYGEYGTDRFLGAEMVGPRAEHLAHLLAWAAQNRMTVASMLDMPFYHPVIEEGLRTALRDLQDKLVHGLPEIERCADCTPGL